MTHHGYRVKIKGIPHSVEVALVLQGVAADVAKREVQHSWIE